MVLKFIHVWILRFEYRMKDELQKGDDLASCSVLYLNKEISPLFLTTRPVNGDFIQIGGLNFSQMGQKQEKESWLQSDEKRWKSTRI